MILFLDFDGVLHPKYIGAKYFCHTGLLWQILRSCPDAQVVFSTSWREAHKPEELLDFATYGGGEDLAHRFIGQTPILKARSDHDLRDLEIQHWLDTNQHTGHWLALDDMPELFRNEHPNLYLVDGSTGLTEGDVAAIIQRYVNYRRGKRQPSGVTEQEWNQRMLANMDRMAADEEYRKLIAKDLS